MDRPLVSVIMPAHNSEATIRRAVASIQRQQYNQLEIVIADDCSQDHTADILNELCQKDKRILVIRLDKNSGPAVARNRAIEASHGIYIAFLDSDDEWNDGKLERQVEILEKCLDIDVVFTNAETIDLLNSKSTDYAEINKIERRGFNFRTIFGFEDIRVIERRVPDQLYRGNFICISTSLVRKSALLRIGCFDERCFGTEDLDLWVRLAYKSQFAYWSQTTTKYYWMPESISRITPQRVEELLRYHKSCYESPDYSELHALVLYNLYHHYKLAIIEYAKQWKILKSWNYFFESLHYPLNRTLLKYAIVSPLGPVPYYLIHYFGTVAHRNHYSQHLNNFNR